MAPPTQAGKFKPRKPAKKTSASSSSAGASSIQPGASVAAAGVAAGVSAAASASASSGGGGGRGRGRGGRGGRGRGRGRGSGRGGRGRGRVQIQQGQAFFTAAEPVAASSAAASTVRFSDGSTNKASAAVDRRLQQQQAQSVAAAAASGAGAAGGVLKRAGGDDLAQSEEVVGMMDEGVGGSTAIAPDKVKSNKKLSSKEGAAAASVGGTQDGAEEGTAGASQAEKDAASRRTELHDQYTYDSDSSMQDEYNNTEQQQLSASRRELEPMTLPFAPIPSPIGIGGTMETRSDHDNFYPVEKGGVGEGPATDDHVVPASATTIITQDPILPSPFVDTTTTNADDINAEKNSWFLVQLPTRLPPLQRNTLNDAPNAATGGDATAGDATGPVMGASATGAPTTTTTTPIAPVATPPVIVDSFDNALVAAKPGRLGRFVVHKSGKTVLVLETPDGGEIRMDATEGLTCAFRQQAVIINHQDRSEFVPLGEVRKSVVVTPDLEAAFPS